MELLGKLQGGKVACPKMVLALMRFGGTIGSGIMWDSHVAFEEMPLSAGLLESPQLHSQVILKREGM